MRPSPPARRYPLQPLAAATGRSVGSILKDHGCGGGTYGTWAEHGVAEEVADVMAVRYGLHPFDVWPDMLDHNLTDAHAPEADLWAAPPAERRRHRDKHRKRRYRAAVRARTATAPPPPDPAPPPAPKTPAPPRTRTAPHRAAAQAAAMSAAEADEIAAHVLGLLTHLADVTRRRAA